MPTSVLLAVLAAAGLLALAPALVRRYDATERIAAERVRSTARVLERHRRTRTVPGRHPVRPPLSAEAEIDERPPVRVPAQRSVGRAVWLPVLGPARRTAATAGPADRADAEPLDGAAPAPRSTAPAVVPAQRTVVAVGRARVEPVPPREAVSARAAARRRARYAPAQSPAVYRRRRVLAALVMFNIVELIGVATVSPGFWTGFGVTAMLLLGYLVHLRNEALADRRRRRVEARRAAYVAAVQARIRAEHTKRLAARRDALRRAAAARAAAQREAVRLSQRYVDFDPAHRARVRGRAYETSGYDGRAVGE